MTDLCVFRSCTRQVAPYSRVACTDHAADVEREMEILRAKTGHRCEVHELATVEMFSEEDRP